jgi:hypothetical protein
MRTIRSTSAIGGIHRLENPGKNLLELIEFDQKKNKPSREIALDSPSANVEPEVSRRLRTLLN